MSTSRPRDLIPNPLTEDGHARCYHRDLARLTPDQAWAEQTILAQWLADRIFRGVRPRYITDAATDQSWARDRLPRLRAVIAGRRAA